MPTLSPYESTTAGQVHKRSENRPELTPKTPNQTVGEKVLIGLPNAQPATSALFAFCLPVPFSETVLFTCAKQTKRPADQIEQAVLLSTDNKKTSSKQVVL